MSPVCNQAKGLLKGIAARAGLVVILSALPAGRALAGEWGTSNWGELAWGASLTAVPMLGLVGYAGLAASVLGLGMWLIGSASRYPDDPQD